MRVCFISTMAGSTWGGSEELWGEAALALRRMGHEVAAGMLYWDGPSPERDKLREAGCEVWIHLPVPALKDRILNRLRPTRLLVRDDNAILRHIEAWKPDLVVISQMFTDDGLSWMEYCRAKHFPYATIVQAATETAWPSDAELDRLRSGYLGSRRAFFVSRHNLELAEKQMAASLPQGEVVANPFGVGHADALPWPGDDGVTRLACVGRIQPDAKGQDVLVDALARPEWQERRVEVTFFGRGANRRWLEDYCAFRGLKAAFGGFAQPSDIWKAHHALVHPSRKEGMPIVMVEAALSGRVVIAGCAGGIPEFVREGETGFLSKGADAECFASCLERAWQRRDDWPAIGAAAAEKARAMLPESPAEVLAEKLLSLAA